ncbi:hypothetical protein [Mycolicibacterium hodleri]|uniref:Uncharacterized protein n=1 Tax=Mycolicibacterium hodleri TaxID=49897 RepID=A0A502E9A9_9MYCO|nr:hypothetical protein [Mycolicibacterium hodleri]TPG34213.1 hypothetical protein EAH80_11480 [Mycolicibacterium hodleri]
MELAPPFVVSDPPECRFYRSLDELVLSTRLVDVEVYDAHGVRLATTSDGFDVSSVEPDQLAHVLRRWLGHMDALRESTASWPLWLLVHAAVEHTGYSR